MKGQGRLKLRTALSLFLIIVGVVPTLVLSFFINRQDISERLQLFDNQILSTSGFISLVMTQTIDRTLNDLFHLDRLHTNKHSQEEIHQAMQNLYEENIYSMIFATDNRGKLTLSEPEVGQDGLATKGRDVSQRDYFKEVMLTKQVSISKPQVGMITGVPSLRIAKPVLNSQGQVDAVVAVALDFEKLERILFKAIAFDKNISLLIVDNQNRVISRLNAEQTLIDSIIVMLNRSQQKFPDQFSPREVSLDTGEKIQMSGTTIERVGWRLFVFYDRKVITGALMSHTWQYLLMTVLVLLIVTAVVLFIARRIAGPIRALSEAAQSISEKKFEVGEALDGLSLFTAEFVELRSSIKSMAQELEKYTADLQSEIQTKTQQLSETNTLLEERNRLLESFNVQKNQTLGVAAHDLRSPLNGIIGFSSVLLEPDSGLSEESRDLVQRIHRQAETMLRFINDILDITKIESGNLDLKLGEVKVIEVIEDTLQLHQVIADKKNVKLEFVRPVGEPTIVADRAKIDQVLNNLLSNAIKFSHANSLVEIFVEESIGEILISVRDHGQGIAPNDIGKLFTPFQQASSSPTKGEKGTGLGLAIVKRIVQGHGGRVWVESQVGEGTAFFVALPKQRKMQHYYHKPTSSNH